MNFDAIQQAPAAIQWHALAAIWAFLVFGFTGSFAPQ